MLAGLDVIADVHQRDRVVEMLLGRLELVRHLVEVLVARVHVDIGAIGQFLAGTAEDLLKVRLGLVKLVFLHRAQTSLVVLDSLRDPRIIGHGLFRSGFLSHV